MKHAFLEGAIIIGRKKRKNELSRRIMRGADLEESLSLLKTGTNSSIKDGSTRSIEFNQNFGMIEFLSSEYISSLKK